MVNIYQYSSMQTPEHMFKAPICLHITQKCQKKVLKSNTFYDFYISNILIKDQFNICILYIFPFKAPQHWAALFPHACSGQSQSPIDIKTAETVYDPSLKDFAIFYDPPLPGSKFFVHNNGHSST